MIRGVYLLLLISFVCCGILGSVLKNHLSRLKQPWTHPLMIRSRRLLMIRRLILVNDVQKTCGPLRLNVFAGRCRGYNSFFEHIRHRCVVIFRHHSWLVMLFEVIQSRMIVFSGCHLLSQVMQLQVLRLEIELRSHQIIPVSLISQWEFNLIYFVLDH